ncbi:MAG: tetratricopeptide repeat protein [Bacteroidetes bacterium]|nr:tetratricopeptide repeat protein [Bacteroidota bacterium]
MKIVKYFLSLSLLATIFFSCTSEEKKLSQKIEAEEKGLINDTTKMVNMEKALVVIQDYLKYTEQFPNDTMSANYYFRAADLCVGIKDYNRSVELLDKLMSKFPEHRLYSKALFLQAFVYENNIRDVEKAKAKYSEFIQKFPNSPMVEGAKGSLYQLEQGLSDEDLVKSFMQKQDTSAN